MSAFDLTNACSILMVDLVNNGSFYRTHFLVNSDNIMHGMATQIIKNIVIRI